MYPNPLIQRAFHRYCIFPKTKWHYQLTAVNYLMITGYMNLFWNFFWLLVIVAPCGLILLFHL